MVILIHSSKTMRQLKNDSEKMTQPQFIDKSSELMAILKQKSTTDIAKLMKISDALAAETKTKIDLWSPKHDDQTPAIDSFIGDIYSGLRSTDLTTQQRKFAQKHLRILSGLYGALRPFDGVAPYRLEMGYRLSSNSFKNLYDFWGSEVAESLPKSNLVINVSAEEYTKAILPYVNVNSVVKPRFLTINKATNKPTFVVVHAKIARGAFARWCLINEVKHSDDLKNFNDLGYVYEPSLSKEHEPVFICKEFGGLGLSQRLTKTT